MGIAHPTLPFVLLKVRMGHPFLAIQLLCHQFIQ
jgi:hypothetical protein